MVAARDPPAEAGVTRRETLPEKRFPCRGRFTTDSLTRMLPPLRSVVKKPSRASSVGFTGDRPVEKSAAQRPVGERLAGLSARYPVDENLTLGLDVGIASVGSAVVRSGTNSEILFVGSRCFRPPRGAEDPQLTWRDGPEELPRTLTYSSPVTRRTTRTLLASAVSNSPGSRRRASVDGA